MGLVVLGCWVGSGWVVLIVGLWLGELWLGGLLFGGLRLGWAPAEWAPAVWALWLIGTVELGGV